MNTMYLFSFTADKRCFPDDWERGACPYLRGHKITNTPDETTTRENYRACWEHCKQLDIEGKRDKGSKAPGNVCIII